MDLGLLLLALAPKLELEIRRRVVLCSLRAESVERSIRDVTSARTVDHEEMAQHHARRCAMEALADARAARAYEAS